MQHGGNIINQILILNNDELIAAREGFPCRPRRLTRPPGCGGDLAIHSVIVVFIYVVAAAFPGTTVIVVVVVGGGGAGIVFPAVAATVFSTLILPLRGGFSLLLLLIATARE
jgi:hypothetical protein